MSLIGNLFRRALDLRTEIKLAPLRKSAAQADNLMDFIHPVVALLYEEVAQRWIAENVSEWCLDNKVLMTFLGYLAGIVTTAEAVVTKSSRRNIFFPREIAFARLVKIFFGDIPNTHIWLSATEITVQQGICPDQIGDLFRYSHEFQTAFIASREIYTSFLSTSPDGPLLLLKLEVLFRHSLHEDDLT